jgi:hypothetical protein
MFSGRKRESEVWRHFTYNAVTHKSSLDAMLLTTKGQRNRAACKLLEKTQLTCRRGSSPKILGPGPHFPPDYGQSSSIGKEH